MRTLPLLVTLLLVGVGLSALAPQASAFTYCTSIGLVTRECGSHVVCIGGGGYGTYRERCQYGVPREPCDILLCSPPPPLP